MTRGIRRMPWICAAVALLFSGALAKKALVFDENQGIIWVEEGQKSKKGFKPPKLHAESTTVVKKVRVRRRIKTVKPGEYLATGMKFYSSGDYPEAIKYFEKAWDKEQNPLYYFWIGACHRKMGEILFAASIFREIVEQYPKSGVADDALFYLAVQAQKNHNYQRAHEYYKNVVELHPEGTSEVGNFTFREEAKNQLRAMKIDIISRLKILKYSESNAMEMLKEFQEKCKLPVTGRPDRKTVLVLVRMSDLMEVRLAKKVSNSEALRSIRLVYVGIMNFLILASIIWGFRNLMVLGDEHRRLEIMSRDLS
jgi:tetratricopeptide (TPR) repeat protein